MKTKRCRLLGSWPLALLLGSGALWGCSRATRETPEQRTERVAPETLPIAPQVAPPIEQQDAERAAQQEKERAQNEAARGMPPAPAVEKSDVAQAEVGAERGEGQAAPCEHPNKGEHAQRGPEHSGARGGERGASGKDRTASELSGVEGVGSQVGSERGRSEVSSAPMTLKGTLLYGGPRLPETAQIRVQLLGADSGDTLSEHIVPTQGMAPYAFSLQLPPGTTDASRYALRVTIEDHGEVLYSTMQPYTPNLAEGSVLPVKIRR